MACSFLRSGGLSSTENRAHREICPLSLTAQSRSKSRHELRKHLLGTQSRVKSLIFQWVQVESSLQATCESQEAMARYRVGCGHYASESIRDLVAARPR